MLLKNGKILGTVMIAILFCSLAFGQNNRPANVPPEQLPSRDIRHHITFIPQETFQAFSDSNTTLIGWWARGPCYAVDVSGNIAYFGNGLCLEVVDISDPANPVELGRIVTPSIVRGVAVSGSYAYVADGDDGMYIIQNDLLLVINEESSYSPGSFFLAQNYPNPFNPITTFKYGLPKPSDVSLKIYNILGQEVATLVDEHQPAGYHLISWDATGHSSGFYFCQIQAGEFQEIRKMILLK